MKDFPLRVRKVQDAHHHHLYSTSWCKLWSVEQNKWVWRGEGGQRGTEGGKTSLFTAIMIVHIENPKEYTSKLLECTKK